MRLAVKPSRSEGMRNESEPRRRSHVIMLTAWTEATPFDTGAHRQLEAFWWEGMKRMNTLISLNQPEFKGNGKSSMWLL